MAERTADVTWDGDLAKGSGKVSATSSQTFKQVGVSWPARTEQADGRTSPEELLAAAHASCFAMALSGGLGRAGTPPKKLDVRASVSFERVGEGWQVTSSKLNVRGNVPGIDAAAFRKAAETAKENCPISKALKGNVDLSVEANLSG